MIVCSAAAVPAAAVAAATPVAPGSCRRRIVLNCLLIDPAASLVLLESVRRPKPPRALGQAEKLHAQEREHMQHRQGFAHDAASAEAGRGAAGCLRPSDPAAPQ